MKITQLSIFLENRPGSLLTACQTLAEHHISMRTLSLADTEHFGILRIIVRETAEAKKALEEAGFIVRTTEVVAIPVADRAGGLCELLATLADCQVEYMYAFTFGKAQKAVMVFRFADPDRALEALAKAHVESIDTLDELLGDK